MYWERPLGPKESWEYSLDASRVLASGEAIDSVTAETTAEGLDTYGLTVAAPTINGTAVRTRLSIAPGMQDLAAFNSGGIRLPVTFLITTDNVPPNIIEQTVLVSIQQK